MWDHHFESPPVDGTHPAFETVSIMTALALETSNVRVGCLVFSPAYRNPALLAKAICTIDHVSGGRAEIGLGAGWHEPEYHAFGYRFPRPGIREDMLEESAQIVRAMLRDGKATFEGEHFRVQDAYCIPAPLQPNLRIWIGGGGERRTIPAAARYADGWNVAYVSPDDFARKAAALDRACEAIGRDPASIARTVNVGFYCGISERDAERERGRLPWGPDDPRMGGVLTGTVTQAVERLGDYADAGAEQINLALRAPFDTNALQALVEQLQEA